MSNTFPPAKDCSECHQGTFEQWTASGREKETCQQCHMPGVTRKMTQSAGGFADVIVAMEHQTPQRRHVFAIPTSDSTGEMFELEIRRRDTEAEVRLHNRLPHSLPTGDYGFRVLALEISTVDGQGTEHMLAHDELAPETKNAIQPQGTWQRLVTVPAGSTSVRVQLRRHSYEDQAILSLLDRTIAL